MQYNNPVRHKFPLDRPRPPHIPWNKDGYYASRHRPSRPLPVQSLLVRKISALVAYTATYAPVDVRTVDAAHLYAMCMELQVALHQYEAHVHPYLVDKQHERNLFDAYMKTISSQSLRVVQHVPLSSSEVSREIQTCSASFVRELDSEVCWMRRQEIGCMLNLQHKIHMKSMLMLKIDIICQFVLDHQSCISTDTQRQIHSKLLVLEMAINEHQKYIRKYLSNDVDERPTYEARKHYLIHDPVVGIRVRSGHDSIMNARHIINRAEFDAMRAIGIRDPYNSVLGLTPTPAHNIHYRGKHHHGWCD